MNGVVFHGHAASRVEKAEIKTLDAEKAAGSLALCHLDLQINLKLIRKRGEFSPAALMWQLAYLRALHREASKCFGLLEISSSGCL